MDRRDFLRLGVAGCAAASCPIALERIAAAERAAPETAHLARHWRGIGGDRVRCELCPRRCEVGSRERGYCGVRRNEDGQLYTLVHSRPCTVRSDPIEKKPLFHYRPGTDAYSLATAGCNLECLFCQNWRISQFRPDEVQSIDLPPSQVVSRALAAGARSVACTYSEPIVFYEYMYDIAVEGRRHNLGTVMISNGFIERGPMNELLGVLDGVKIDLKAFRDSFYRELCDGELRPVLDTLRLIRRRGVWLEIVVLIIPTRNDDEGEIRAMARWIRQELGPDVPLHFSRYHPTYRLTNLPPTPVRTIERLRQVALDAGLRYVYLGNVRGHPAENTRCHSCGHPLIGREGYVIRYNHVSDGRCPECDAPIPGVWG